MGALSTQAGLEGWDDEVARDRPLAAQRRTWRPPGRVLIALVGLLALAAGGEPLALLATLGLTAVHVPAQDPIRRTALAGLALIGLNAVILTVLAVFNLSWDPELILGLELVLAAVLPPCTQVAAGEGASQSDRWALGGSILTFLILYAPFVGASTGRTMALLTYASDSATHLQLVQEIRQYGGYIHLRDTAVGLPGMTDYPAAWAGNLALSVHLILGDGRNIADFMRTVAPMIVAGYALLIYFSIAVVLDVVFHLMGRVSRGVGLFASGCLVLTSIFGVNVFLLEGGFYTQMLAMGAILGAIAVQGGSGTALVRELVLLSLLTIVVMQTWYLLAPVMASVLLVYAVTRRPNRIVLLCLASPTALLCAYPVLTGPRAEHINAVGASPLPTIAGLIGLLLVACLGALFILLTAGRGREQRLSLGAALVSTLVLVVAVLVVQASTKNSFNYYLFKLLYTTFLLGTIAGTAAAATALSRGLAREADRRMQASATVALVVLGLAAGIYSTRSLAWPYAAGRPPEHIDGTALDALFASYPSGLPLGTDAWMLDGCHLESDHLASKWAYDLSLSWTPTLQDTYLDFAFGRKKAGDVDMLADRLRTGQTSRIEVYVHRNCAPEAWRALRALPGVVVNFV